MLLWASTRWLLLTLHCRGVRRSLRADVYLTSDRAPGQPLLSYECPDSFLCYLPIVMRRQQSPQSHHWALRAVNPAHAELLLPYESTQRTEFTTGNLVVDLGRQLRMPPRDAWPSKACTTAESSATRTSNVVHPSV